MRTETPEAGTPLVVLDAGNSRLKAVVIDPRRHLPVLAVPAGGGLADLPAPEPVGQWELPAADDPAAAALAAAAAAAVRARSAGPVVLVSVVPAWTELLRGALPGLAVLEHGWTMPFLWDVAQASAVGPDRIANVAMAAAWGLQDALVVDAGTATTFDLLDGGAFKGGLIAPGMAFAAAKLGEYAARLAPVPFGPCPLEVGTDTAGAMAAGAWHTSFFGVNGTIEALLKAYGPRPVILTGGLGRFLAVEGRHVDPFWTLRGAGWLYLQQG